MNTKITTFKNLQDTHGHLLEISQDELVERLAKHHAVRNKKDAPLWSAAEFEGKRAKANVRRVCQLVFDSDKGATLEQLSKHFAAYAGIVHSTASHTPAVPKYRVVLLLSRPLEPAEHGYFYRHFLSRAELAGIVLDRACSDPSRMFFDPSVLVGHEAEAQVARLSGESLDADALKAQLDPESTKVAAARSWLRLSARPAIQGANGSRDLFGAACWIIGNYGLTEHQAEQCLADVYNQRCSPPWTSSEIAHKVNDAFRKVKATGKGSCREVQAPTFADMEFDWWLKLVGSRKSGMPRENLRTVRVVLDNDPLFAGKLRFDSFLGRHVILAGSPLGEARYLEDGDAAALYDYLCDNYGLEGLTLSTCLSGLIRTCEVNAYNSQQQYLSALKWDGVPRVDKAFVRYLNAEDNAYSRGVSTRFFVGAVARAMKPGCQRDEVPVLIGKQGEGKSRFLRALGGPWHMELKCDLDTKDAVSGLRGKWIVELGELASVRKSEIEAMRSFVTCPIDSYRPPYARLEISSPRACVFVGTTNDHMPLTDHAGNRRFWPIEVGRCAYYAVLADRDQLWAEAVAKYNAGEAWHADTAEFLALARQAQQAALKPHLYDREIELFSAKQQAYHPYDGVSIDDIRVQLVSMELCRRDDKRAPWEIAEVLRKNGWTTQQVGADRKRRWFAPEVAPNEAQPCAIAARTAQNTTQNTPGTDPQRLVKDLEIKDRTLENSKKENKVKSEIETIEVSKLSTFTAPSVRALASHGDVPENVADSFGTLPPDDFLTLPPLGQAEIASAMAGMSDDLVGCRGAVEPAVRGCQRCGAGKHGVHLPGCPRKPKVGPNGRDVTDSEMADVRMRLGAKPRGIWQGGGAFPDIEVKAVCKSCGRQGGHEASCLYEGE